MHDRPRVVPPEPQASDQRSSKWRLLSDRTTRLALSVLGAAGIAFADATNGRSFALWSLVGLWAIPFGWAMLTNAGGIWDQHVARQQRRRERLSRVPLGRLYWSVDRQDHEIHRAFIGISGIIVGLAFIALGALAGLDVIDVNGQ